MAHPFSRLSAFGLLLVALIASSNFTVASGPAAMVKDIQSSLTDNVGSRIERILSVGDAAYFFALDPNNGMELWRSDGTEGGTRLLKDINPGNGSAQPLPASTPMYDIFMQRVGDLAFFVADDGSHGAELWRTDGTPAGTALLRDIWPGSEGSRPLNLTAVGNMLFFLANDGQHGLELWKSDGTSAGTSLVADLFAGSIGSEEYGLTAVNNKLFFFAETRTGNVNVISLWTSDGTPEGTTKIVDVRGTCYQDFALASLNNLLYFANCTQALPYLNLWRSDGTPAGTFALTNESFDFLYSSYRRGERQLVALNDAIYFMAHDQLWRTTGLTTTTQMVANRPAHQLTQAGSRLFFSSSTSATGDELWISDGTEAGTRLVMDINPGSPSSIPERMLAHGDSIRFAADDGVHGRELWESDGTALGTHLVRDLMPGSLPSIAEHTPLSNTAGPTSWEEQSVDRMSWDTLANGELLFIANDGIHSDELWRSDGTFDGTQLVKDLFVPSDSARISYPVSVGNQLIFEAMSQQDRHIWRSDGTFAGTVPLTSEVHLSSMKTVVSDTLFFVDYALHPYARLWRSDGTDAGTQLVTTISTPASGVRHLLSWQGSLVFLANRQLWRSDGTAAGTAPFGPVGVVEFAPVGNALIFSIQGDNSWEMWLSDGSQAGTKRFFPDAANAALATGNAPALFTAANNLIFFLTRGENQQLWRTDGTNAGTVLLKTISFQAPFTYPGVFSNSLGTLGNKIYFTAFDNEHGTELWVSDGTDTQRVADIMPSYGSSSPDAFAVMNGLLYFAATSPEGGRELWRSDGTSAGTVQVSDINPGIESSNPTQLLVTPMGLVFTATTATYGTELWRSDGTSEGTLQVQDINPGPAHGLYTANDRQTLTRSGERLFFEANDAIHGDELWSIRLDDAFAPTLTPTSSPSSTSSPMNTATTDVPTSESTTTPSTTPTMTSTPTGPTVSGRNRALLPFVVAP